MQIRGFLWLCAYTGVALLEPPSFSLLQEYWKREREKSRRERNKIPDQKEGVWDNPFDDTSFEYFKHSFNIIVTGSHTKLCLTNFDFQEMSNFQASWAQRYVKNHVVHLEKNLNAKRIQKMGSTKTVACLKFVTVAEPVDLFYINIIIPAHI